MKHIYKFCMTATLFLTVFLLAMHGIRRNEEALASRLAPEVLRFHVLANSDSPEDQTLKFAVKDLLLKTIQDDLAASGTLTKDMVKQYILDNKFQLEQKADSFIEETGFDYVTEIRLETCEFPRKTYGDLTFPGGTYEAVRVLIGDGTGENFWCVLYPSLCYIDTTYAIMPEESIDLLQTLIPEDDFSALLTAKRKLSSRSADEIVTSDSGKQKTEQDSLLPRITIRFRLFDLLSDHLSD